MKLYFDCTSGISGDMAVGALLDLGADKNKMIKALKSLNIDDEFEINITKKSVNAIIASDFDVILKEHHHHEKHHHHRNLNDIFEILNKADTDEKTLELAKKIFTIIAQAEAKVHNKDIKDIHFHEVGATDSIVDILSFSVLYNDLNPTESYFSTLYDGIGTIECQHGLISIPVPAVCEIISNYKIPIKITQNEGEMVTPTGAAIVAALFNNKKLDEEIIIKKIGYGSGKRPYKNPILRIMAIE